MDPIERMVLRVKRRDGAIPAAIHDLYRWILRFDLPDSAVLRHLARLAWRARDLASHGGELVASKLVVEPMARARFASMGRGVHVTELPFVLGHCDVRVGDGCSLSKIQVFSGRFCDRPELTIGRGTQVGYMVTFSVNRRVTVGEHVGIATRAVISDSDGHPADLSRRLRGEPLAPSDILPVTIGDRVWIGRSAHVQKGVTIGRGAVVAAGSVVTSDVPEGALAMGVPARVITRPWER